MALRKSKLPLKQFCDNMQRAQCPQTATRKEQTHPRIQQLQTFVTRRWVWHGLLVVCHTCRATQQLLTRVTSEANKQTQETLSHLAASHLSNSRDTASLPQHTVLMLAHPADFCTTTKQLHSITVCCSRLVASTT